MNKFNLAMALMLLVILIVIAYRNTTESFQVTSLNNANLVQGVVPGGTIVAWSPKSTPVNIPTGWHPCDGSNYTASDGSSQTTPNLIGRFVLGATHNSEKKNDGTSNVWDGDFNPSNGNKGGKQKVALTKAQMPNHKHVPPDHKSATIHLARYNHPHGDYEYIGPATPGIGDGFHDEYGKINLLSEGSNQAHENMPPYYSLIYIMKTY